jgi:hypothetical protein
VTGGSFTLFTGIYSCLGKPARQFFGTLAASSTFSVLAGSDVTALLFTEGALRERCVALVQENEVVYRVSLHVHATADGRTAHEGAPVLTADPK